MSLAYELPQQAFTDEDEELQRAIRESAAEAAAYNASAFAGAAVHPDGLSDEQALEQALRESTTGQNAGIRKLMRPGGPFFPAGLANSGNSCFWNALLQVLFAATPVLRGAFFQLEERSAVSDPVLNMQALSLMRDLFAEMDMGLADAIDAALLYQRIFQTRDEADVAEQMHKVFSLTLSGGPSPLRSVFAELFSGDLYEHQSAGGVRSIPLDLCQLDLCITAQKTLEELLEEHTRDVHGSIVRRSYRLPPVLWLNLDRFVFDPVTQQGQKRNVRVTIPEVLNTWMLMPQEAPWLARVRESAAKCQSLRDALEANRSEVAACTPSPDLALSAETEKRLTDLVERQEAMNAQLEEAEQELARCGAEQELLYHLEAVIVHRGHVDSGHYFSYSRSPDTEQPGWCCISDASVEQCSFQEMCKVCEGGDADAVPAEDGVEVAKLRLANHVAQSGPSSNSRGATAPSQPQQGAAAGGGNTPLLHLPAAAAGEPNASSRDPDASPLPVVATGRKERKKGGLLSSVFGCLPRRGNAMAVVESLPPESQDHSGGGGAPAASPFAPELPEGSISSVPTSVAGVDDKAVKDENAAGATAADARGGSSEHLPSSSSQVSPGAAGKEPSGGGDIQAPELGPGQQLPGGVTRPAPSTAARCLIYVRRRDGGGNLLEEVKLRVPKALQEKIDVQNQEVLRLNAERVAEDFVKCIRHVTSHVPVSSTVDASSGNAEKNGCARELQEALQTAMKIRADGGMSYARMYVLREVWRLHIPWLPEELSATASPPDFRMHYGSTAKRLVLDALIKRGQHDVATLLAPDAQRADVLVPPEVARWFASRGL